MRVLLDCRMASWTGVGRYTTGLARALAARGDIELIQVAASGERPPVAPHQGATSIVATKHPFALAGARELGRIAASADADVVHCAHFPTPMPPSHPLVVTIHDLMPLLVPGIMTSPLKRAVYRYWNGRAAKIADRVVTPSQFTAADVERLFKRAEGKTRVTAEAADEFAQGPMGQLDSALVEVSDWPYLLSMGSTRKHKDLPTLMRAFATVAASRPELRLLLVGAENRAFIEESLAGTPADIRDRVLFTGRVDDPQLRTLMAGAQIFAFPSRYEGFGLPPLEAMAFGAPCVVADAASLPEVVGDAALRFPPGDATALAEALERLLGSPELREEYREAGYRRAEGFSWAHTAEATVAVYREVLAEHADAGREAPGDEA
jgi:glycosyltransferase involved in cell wall biosynthesis